MTKIASIILYWQAVGNAPPEALVDFDRQLRQKYTPDLAALWAHFDCAEQSNYLIAVVLDGLVGTHDFLTPPRFVVARAVAQPWQPVGDTHEIARGLYDAANPASKWQLSYTGTSGTVYMADVLAKYRIGQLKALP